MAIVIKDGNNSSLNLKATYNASTNEYTPHHIVDSIVAISGFVHVQSGLIGATGTLAVSGDFPSGIQYQIGETLSADNYGNISLFEKPDGSLSGLKQTTSGSLFVVNKYNDIDTIFSNVVTIESESDVDVLSAPSNTSKRHFITSITASNASTTGTICTFKSNSVNLFSSFLADQGGGVAQTFTTPIVCPTGKSFTAALGTATQSVIISVQGYTE